MKDLPGAPPLKLFKSLSISLFKTLAGGSLSFVE
jgi:hypothetical protein